MAIPFVNSVLLQRFINKQVRVVGEVLNADPDRATLRTSDNGTIVVNTIPGGMHYSEIVEFTGTWTPNGTLQETTHLNYSRDFDLKAHNRLLGLMHGPFRDLFSDTTV